MDRERVQQLANQAAQRVQGRYPTVTVSSTAGGSRVDENLIVVHTIVSAKGGSGEREYETAIFSPDDLRRSTEEAVRVILEKRNEADVYRFVMLPG